MDEVQSILNWTGITARAVCSIQRKRSWGMTGTLIRSYISDFYAYFRFLRVPKFSVLEDFKRVRNAPAQHINRRRDETGDMTDAGAGISIGTRD